MMEEIGILPTDIIPMITYAWNRSFARVNTNKKAIYERGWFPFNRVLLLDKEIRESMTVGEKREEMIAGLFPFIREAAKEKEATKDWSTYDPNLLTTNQPLHSLPSVNMDSGTAHTVLTIIAKNSDLNAIRKKAKENKLVGSTLKQRLQESKKISTTVITTNGTHRLGRTVRDVVRDNKKKENYCCRKSKTETLLHTLIM